MRGHQVGDQVLFLSCGFGNLVEAFLKGAVGLNMRLAHVVEYVLGAVFGGDLELSADVMCNKFPEKGFIGVLHEIVVPDARPDKDLFDFGKGTDFPEQIEVFPVVHFQ